MPAIDGAVDAGQHASQQFVVVPEFEQLRIGVFQQLHRGSGSDRIIEHERGRPPHHQQIVRVIGNAGRQDLLELCLRKRPALAAHDLRDFAAVPLEQIGGVFVRAIRERP